MGNALPEMGETGQTACYDSSGTEIFCTGTGQDGDGRYGVGHGYTDKGDGTIVDNKTGLMWEKLDDSNLAGLAGVHDWDRYFTWDEAFAKIADLNGSAFAGYTDWRLPNVRELFSLVYLAPSFATIDPKFRTGCAPGCTITTCGCTRMNRYWSSSTYQYTPTFGWFVSFFDGITSGKLKTELLFARAVRGG